VPGLDDVEQVVTSDLGATCTRHRDGSVRCWGDGSHGALGSTPTGFCSGRRGSEPCATRPRRVPGLTGADRVFVGVWGGCVIRHDHSVWCWGTLAPGGNVALTPVPW
jgi:alpha-tubulin suppressor-like RCC1 family protein